MDIRPGHTAQRRSLASVPGPTLCTTALLVASRASRFCAAPGKIAKDASRLGLRQRRVNLLAALIERGLGVLAFQHYALHRAVYRFIDLEDLGRALHEAPASNVLHEHVEIAGLAGILDPGQRQEIARGIRI